MRGLSELLSRVWQGRWQIGRWLIVILLAVGICDYVWYHLNLRAALAPVNVAGGRSGSLLGWPLGRELRITFPRPVTDEELQQLQILNQLDWRHSVGVLFDFEMEPAEFQRLKAALPRCHVFQRRKEDVQPVTGP